MAFVFIFRRRSRNRRPWTSRIPRYRDSVSDELVQAVRQAGKQAGESGCAGGCSRWKHHHHQQLPPPSRSRSSSSSRNTARRGWDQYEVGPNAGNSRAGPTSVLCSSPFAPFSTIHHLFFSLAPIYLPNVFHSIFLLAFHPSTPSPTFAIVSSLITLTLFYLLLSLSLPHFLLSLFVILCANVHTLFYIHP